MDDAYTASSLSWDYIWQCLPTPKHRIAQPLNELEDVNVCNLSNLIDVYKAERKLALTQFKYGMSGFRIHQLHLFLHACFARCHIGHLLGRHRANRTVHQIKWTSGIVD